MNNRPLDIEDEFTLWQRDLRQKLGILSEQIMQVASLSPEAIDNPTVASVRGAILHFDMLAFSAFALLHQRWLRDNTDSEPTTDASNRGRALLEELGLAEPPEPFNRRF